MPAPSTAKTLHCVLLVLLSIVSGFVPGPQALLAADKAYHVVVLGDPHVMLWISGHTHTSPKEESFASDINRAGQVTNIHTTDMNRKNVWTNSLYLYSDRVVVKTFNHTTGQWLPQLERSFPVKTSD